jgi:hypothetical protein
MKHTRVCVVGNTLFAETVAQMLFDCETVNQLDCFPSMADAFGFIDGKLPDVLILVDIDTTVLVGDTPFLPICPDIPVICTSHDSTTLKLITTTHVSARLPELIDLVTSLKRVQM